MEEAGLLTDVTDCLGVRSSKVKCSNSDTSARLDLLDSDVGDEGRLLVPLLEGLWTTNAMSSGLLVEWWEFRGLRLVP